MTSADSPLTDFSKRNGGDGWFSGSTVGAPVTAVFSVSDAEEPAVGLDFTVDAVGVPTIMESAIHMAAPGGRIVVLGFNPTPARVPELLLVRKELKVMGTRMNCNRFPEVLEWFAKGQVHPDALLSGVYPLAEINRAFEDIAAAPDSMLKVVVTL